MNSTRRSVRLTSGIENFAIEEKRAMDAPSSPQGFAKRNVINVTQIAPETRPEWNRAWITFVSAAAAD
jgi:hypothetical protein